MRKSIDFQLELYKLKYMNRENKLGGGGGGFIY